MHEPLAATNTFLDFRKPHFLPQSLHYPHSVHSKLHARVASSCQSFCRNNPQRWPSASHSLHNQGKLRRLARSRTRVCERRLPSLERDLQLASFTPPAARLFTWDFVNPWNRPITSQHENYRNHQGHQKQQIANLSSPWHASLLLLFVLHSTLTNFYKCYGGDRKKRKNALLLHC